jgi:hypothetical protein
VNAELLRAVWVVSAAAVAGAAVAAIVTVLRGEPGDDDAKTVFSLIAVFLCGGAAVAALQLLDRSRLRVLGAVVLVAAAVEVAMLEVGIWKAIFFDGESNDYVKLIPTGLAWAIATIVIATLPLMATSRLVLMTAVPVVGACALVGATIATVMTWREVDSTNWDKTLAALAILMVAGYLLTPLAERIVRLQETSASRTSASSDTARV